MDTTGKAGQTAYRVECIARLLLRGMGRRSVHDWVGQAGWGVSTRTVDRLIQRAAAGLAKEADRFVNLRAEFATAKHRLEALYKAALSLDPPDIRAALACQRELIALLGLSATRAEGPAVDDAISFDIVGVKDEGDEGEPAEGSDGSPPVHTTVIETMNPAAPLT